MLAMAHVAACIKYRACPLFMVSLSNQLSGEIPPELGNLANLTWLVLGRNQLIECVPNSLSGRLMYSDLGDLQFYPLSQAHPAYRRDNLSARSAQVARSRVPCALRNLRRPPDTEPSRPKSEGCWSVSTGTTAAGRSSFAGNPTSGHRLRSNPADAPLGSPSGSCNRPETDHGC